MTNIAVVDPIVLQLQQAFEDFQTRAEKLSIAYATMQEEFKKVNIELDRKNIELTQTLQRQDEMQVYLHSILESMSSGVISIDNNGVITQFNRAAESITGFETTEVLGNVFTEVFAENTFSERNIMTVLISGKGTERDEKVIWQKNGTPLTVSFQCSLLTDSNAKQLGAVEIFNDISKIKALEHEMQQKKTMAALGEMAATVAHEIRNPLGAMGVWAGLLEREFDRNDKRRQTLSKMIDALGQLDRIVSNLLVYSRPVKAKMYRVVLQDILLETTNFVSIEIERSAKHITVKKLFTSNEPIRIMADPEKLQQIIMNLFLNAIQAMPSEGTLSVCCNFLPEDRNYVSFSVIDTGVGIEKTCLEKIFDPFYTTKENGTGLGLAIVKKLVEFHGGLITVKSDEGKGTRVDVFLPKLPNEER